MDEQISIYTPAAGESWDWVALALYGHERYAHYLLTANPEYVDRAVFDGTEVLVVPEIETETDGTAAPAAPWR